MGTREWTRAPEQTFKWRGKLQPVHSESIQARNRESTPYTQQTAPLNIKKNYPVQIALSLHRTCPYRLLVLLLPLRRRVSTLRESVSSRSCPAAPARGTGHSTLGGEVDAASRASRATDTWRAPCFRAAHCGDCWAPWHVVACYGAFWGPCLGWSWRGHGGSLPGRREWIEDR
jgi:hypothetical protein